MTTKILHDWDNLVIGNRRYHFNRMVNSFMYLLSTYSIFSFLRKTRWVKEVYKGKRDYLDTLIQLDNLVGVMPVLGIRDLIFDHYPCVLKEIRQRYGDDKFDFRLHIHLGDDFDDPERIRMWVPDLVQSKSTWSYDSDLFSKDKLVLLKEGELPSIHVDRPFNLAKYIEFLYKIKFEGLELYE